MDKAISWKTDEHFIGGKEYKCDTLNGNLIQVYDNKNNPILVGIDDPDFTFMLNVRTCDECSSYGDFYKPECRECHISGKGDKNNYSDKSENP